MLNILLFWWEIICGIFLFSWRNCVEYLFPGQLVLNIPGFFLGGGGWDYVQYSSFLRRLYGIFFSPGDIFIWNIPVFVGDCMECSCFLWRLWNIPASCEDCVEYSCFLERLCRIFLLPGEIVWNIPASWIDCVEYSCFLERLCGIFRLPGKIVWNVHVS